MSRGWRGAVLAGVVALLVACSDGYPDKADAVMLHYGMDQREALTAMNRIGQGTSRKNAARFALLEGCMLEVHARLPVEGKDSWILPLKGARASMDKTGEGDSYRVGLTPAGATGQARTVMDGVPWTDATQVKWLLEYLQGSC